LEYIYQAVFNSTVGSGLDEYWLLFSLLRWYIHRKQ
jgi:hypothetical protein